MSDGRVKQVIITLEGKLLEAAGKPIGMILLLVVPPPSFTPYHFAAQFEKSLSLFVHTTYTLALGQLLARGRSRIPTATLLLLLPLPTQRHRERAVRPRYFNLS